MKSKTTAALLALFLGGIGIHKFYMGKSLAGFIYLIFFWTFIPAIIGFFESIGLFMMSEEKFQGIAAPTNTSNALIAGSRFSKTPGSASTAGAVYCPNNRLY